MASKINIDSRTLVTRRQNRGLGEATMCADRSNMTLASRRFAMTARLTLFLFSSLLAGTAGAAAGDKTDVVRDLAGASDRLSVRHRPAGTSPGPVFRQSSISSQ